MTILEGSIVDGEDTGWWPVLYPGLNKWAETYGCSLGIDGYIVVMHRGRNWNIGRMGDTVEFDMNHVVSLAKSDEYDEVKEYVRRRCLGNIRWPS